MLADADPVLLVTTPDVAPGLPPSEVPVVTPDESLLRSASNLPSVIVIRADSLNVVDLLNADAVLIEQPALAKMEEVYA